MKKLAIGLLQGFRRAGLAWRRLRGIGEEEHHARRIVSGQSWEEFCDTLKSAGAAMTFPGAPQDPFNQAEGYRYLSRLARAGLEAFVEFADPRAPVLMRVVHETVKMGSDNPDNYYQNAAVHGDYQYRVYGTRGTVNYLGFGTQTGHYGQGGGMPPVGYIEASELEIGPDGRFELLLSVEPQDGNWLPIAPGPGTLIVRQTFGDRAAETRAELVIERVGGDGLPSPVTAKAIDEGLNSASTLVAGAALLFAKWSRDFQKHVNELPRFSQAVSDAAGGDPNIAYYHSYWQLGPEEVLEITATPPDCESWNFQLDNHWMESLDYRYHRIHLNKQTAHYEPDGSLRILVSHVDPGHPNWIETVGHDRGAMSFRWIRAQAHPQPATRVLKLAEIQP